VGAASTQILHKVVLISQTATGACAANEPFDYCM
jgi:hypothetical protein